MTAPALGPAAPSVLPPRDALPFVAQSAAELRYLLCPAALDPARWQVLERRRVALPCGELDLAIIGGSHVLTLRAGDAALTEILACLPAFVPPAPVVADRSARGRWAVRARCGPATYATRFEERRHDKRGFAAAQQDIVDSAPAMLRAFPRGPYPSAPLTAIDVAAAPSGVAVVTYHTYPGERVVAVTRTEVVFPR